jgi:hypothetical protein
MSAISIIVPPAGLLDKRGSPGDVRALGEWLNKDVPPADAAVVALDMLFNGGLMASRQTKEDGWPEQTAERLSLLRSWRAKKSIPLYAFSVIPRLLIPEDSATKQWQYHMMIYALKKDMYDALGHRPDFERVKNMLEIVPPALVADFNKLYEENDRVNYQLALFARGGAVERLTIGQDDGQPFGRPNLNRKKASAYAARFGLSGRMTTTHGADELALLDVAACANKLRRFSPKVKVVYGTESAAELIMPFMPITVRETVEEKIAAVDARRVENIEEADFILFVYCGEKRDAFRAGAAARRIRALAAEKPLALVDLSISFKREEAVLDALLWENIPLSSLIAYAGWNTASNSIGTALAQSSLFLGKLRRTEDELRPYLYYKNFEFTIARILDDCLYQKDVRARTARVLYQEKIDPDALGEHTEFARQTIREYLAREAKLLLYRNAGLYPFYRDRERAYYITSLTVQVDLPWERLFEIRLSVGAEVGSVPLHGGGQEIFIRQL